MIPEDVNDKIKQKAIHHQIKLRYYRTAKRRKLNQLYYSPWRGVSHFEFFNLIGWRMYKICYLYEYQSTIYTLPSEKSPFFLMLLSSKAGGVGLNLTGGSRLILIEVTIFFIYANRSSWRIRIVKLRVRASSTIDLISFFLLSCNNVILFDDVLLSVLFCHSRLLESSNVFFLIEQQRLHSFFSVYNTSLLLSLLMSSFISALLMSPFF